MKIEELQVAIKDKMSIREMAIRFGCSYTTVRYWLGVFGLRSCCGRRKGLSKSCFVCGRDTKRGRWICNSCGTKVRRHRTKLAAVKLLGGKCNRCGWKGNPVAFEFHHVNGDKEFGIGGVSNKSWKVIVDEIRKCELLCAICHRIEHSNRQGDKFLLAVDRYKGDMLDFK